MKDQLRKAVMVDVLAILVILLTFSYYFGLYLMNSSDAKENYSTQILTACIAMDMLVLNYYFGSSKSATTKDDTIRSMQEQAVAKPTISTETATVEHADNVNANTVTNKNTDI